MPRVTVITATYNRPDTLRLAIDSVLAQTWSDYEYWVIGDGCDPRAAAVVAEFADPRLRYDNRAVNSGAPSRPHNDGLERATGEWIAYLAHDDLWLPWHLEALVAELDRSGADLVYSLSARIGPQGLVGCVGPFSTLSDLNQVTCPPSSWLVRREALETIGGWRDPELLPHPIDLDVLLRLDQSGRRLHCLRRLTVLFFAAGLYPGAYQRGAEAQATYAAAIRDDPAALELRLLDELALLFAVHRCPQRGWRGLVRRAARLSGEALACVYGTSRWPLPQVRVSRFQRSRRRRNHRRGLES
jgi:glycosyltransferase involved in cell wall biosynthesis